LTNFYKEKGVKMNYFKSIIEDESKKDYYINLHNFVDNEYKNNTIYPERENIFAGEAHGLSFSVRPEIKIPPSLKNIYKELNSELGCYIPNNGYLVKWAKQGVLLLNAVLTVQKDLPASHRGKGWETFTDKIIEEIDKKDEPVVFMLWGNFAKSKEALLKNPKHLVLTSAHPSPFSARNGFFGNNHFIKANEYLQDNGLTPIDWQIENI
jgi:uracil-DNA glycosylase